MTIDANLTYEDRKEGFHARGMHDKEGKCLHLKAGFTFKLCENPRNAFAYYPELQTFLEKKIIPYAQSAGDDTHFCVTKDVPCYAITDSPNGHNLDELSFAASIIAGKAIKGENVWKNEEGITLKKLRSTQTFDLVDETILNVQRYEDAAKSTFDMILAKRSLLINILSYAYWLNQSFGSKNEDLFMVPRQIDHAMTAFGFQCEEAAAYDLTIPGELCYTVSDKTTKDIFHHKTSRKPRTDTIKGNLMMSNIRAGQSSDSILRPQFDCLLVMQYNPYLVCGIAPYSKIVNYFRIKDGGTVLGKVPIDNFKYVISPTEGVSPEPIPMMAQEEIDKFVRVAQGEFLPDLLKQFPPNTPLVPENPLLW